VELHADDDDEAPKIHRKLLQAKFNGLADKLKERSENTSGNHILQANKAALTCIVE
jgi:hypothetical protein